MKMWRVFSLSALVVTGIAVLSGTAQAQYHNSFINQREAAQQDRIDRGVQSGDLTHQEAGRLAAEQRRIQGVEARLRGDGRLDRGEKSILDHMQNRADRNIYRQSHDNQMAYAGHRNHNQAQYRHWQQNNQRHHNRGNFYSHRGNNGCDRRDSYRQHQRGFQNYGGGGRFHRNQHRDRRFAWN